MRYLCRQGRGRLAMRSKDSIGEIPGTFRLLVIVVVWDEKYRVAESVHLRVFDCLCVKFKDPILQYMGS